MTRMTVLGVLVATVWSTAGCNASSPTGPTTPASVAGLKVQWSDLKLSYSTGAVFGFRSWSVGADGAWSDVTGNTTWTVSNAAVVQPASASTPNVFVAVASGTSDIQATSQQLSTFVGTVTVDAVPQFPLLSIGLSPSISPRLGIVDDVSVRVFLQAAANASIQDVTANAALSSSDSGVAVIRTASGAATLTAVGPGPTDVSATVSGQSTSVRVFVSPWR